MITLRDAIRERLDSGALDLPPLPRVVAEVTEAVEAERGHVQLARIVRRDPAMAANVLRLANSAAYRRGARVETLQQAIARLGQNQLVEMAIAICARAELFFAPGLEPVVDRLWLEAVIGGLWARQLAPRIHGNVESAYLCGLLRDIGKPLVVRELAGLSAGDEAEALIDELFVEVGLRAAEQWKLPRPVIDAIARRGSGVDLIAAIDELTRVAIDGDDPVDGAVFAALGIYPDEGDALLELRDEVREQAGELVS